MTEHECTGWWSGLVDCMVCGHEWCAVWCDCADSGALECPACGALAGMPDPPPAEAVPVG